MNLSAKKTLLLILALAFVIGAIASPTKEKRSKKSSQKSSKKSSQKSSSQKPSSPKDVPIDLSTNNVCRSFTDNFKNSRIVLEKDYNGDPSSADWIDTCGVPGVHSTSSGNLEAYLKNPGDCKKTKGQDGYYNKVLGQGMAFNSTYKIHYGCISMIVKANGVGGCVTAFDTMSDNGDEIDYEIVGGDKTHAQSNYFYNGNLVFGVNGGVHQIPKGGKIDSGFHNYTICWLPEKIEWSIDEQIVRILKKSDTLSKGVYKYPSHPSILQIGIWDASGADGTAQWSNGPIDWTKQPKKLTSTIKQITVKCDPKYNKVVN